MFIILSLFVSVINGQPFGENGQQCSIEISDSLRCRNPVTFQSYNAREVDCSEDFDCCLCGEINCGGGPPGSPRGEFCEKFSAGGDSSAFYVTDINVVGDRNNGGVSIECGGDRSCARATIIGRGVKELKCDGDRACAYATVDIVCLRGDGCEVQCDSDFACIGGPESSFTIVNGAGLKCGDSGCTGQSFEFINNQGGKVECEGSCEGIGCGGACENAVIEIQNIESLKCGENSCDGASITIIDPQQDFELVCEGCAGASVTLIFTEESTVTSIKGFECSKAFGCDGAEFIIMDERSGAPLNIEGVDCEEAGSCRNVFFDLGGAVIERGECKCGDQGGCFGTSGLPPPCVQGTGTPPPPEAAEAPEAPEAPEDPLVVSGSGFVEKLECKEDSPCSDQTINNPANDFEIICGDPAICQDLMVTVNVPAGASGVTNIKGASCGGEGSCQGASFMFYNNRATDIPVEKIDCGGSDSCRDAFFLFDGVSSVEFVCGGERSCRGCMATVNGGPMVPCRTLQSQ